MPSDTAMTYEPDMSETPHLLLVEDERSIREPLAQYLTRQGFRVTQAGDAEGARARMEIGRAHV